MRLRIEKDSERPDGEKRVHYIKVTNLHLLPFWAIIAYLVWEFLDRFAPTLLLFGIAFFFAAVLNRPIAWLDKRGMSRGKSVAIIALVLLTLIGVGIYAAIPPIVEQARAFSENAPEITRRAQAQVEQWTARYPFISEQLNEADLPRQVQEYGQKVLPQVGRYSLNFLTGLLGALFVLLITLYVAAEPRPLLRGALSVVPRKHRTTALRVVSGINTSLQGWVRATFLMMLIIGIMSGFGLWALGVKSWLLFGVIAGIGEAIPTIGPILSAIPPFVVMLGEDPTKAWYVLILFFIIQQIENNLLVPRIMASTLNLHSVSVLFFVVIMGAMIGPIGILLATPTCAIVKVIYQEVYEKRQKDTEEPKPAEAAESG
jgi:putative permease